MRGLKIHSGSRTHPKEMSSEKESNSLSVSEKPRGRNWSSEDVGKTTRPQKPPLLTKLIYRKILISRPTQLKRPSTIKKRVELICRLSPTESQTKWSSRLTISKNCAAWYTRKICFRSFWRVLEWENCSLLRTILRSKLWLMLIWCQRS